MFPEPIHAQYVRILPQTWQRSIAMRVELIGCDLGFLPNTCASQPVDGTTELSQSIDQELNCEAKHFIDSKSFDFR